MRKDLLGGRSVLVHTGSSIPHFVFVAVEQVALEESNHRTRRLFTFLSLLDSEISITWNAIATSSIQIASVHWSPLTGRRP